MNRKGTKATLFTLSALAIFLAAVGCNRGSGSISSKGGGSEGDGVARSAPAPEAVTASAPQIVEEPVAVTSDAETTVRPDETEITPVEYLPPDVATTVSEIDAAPGSVIEIKAEGSSDVVAMSLSDGRTEPTAFRFDDVEGLWRASYRVPLRPTSDRIGLSITAKNATNRWRRVWVFVKAQRETTVVDSADAR